MTDAAIAEIGDNQPEVEVDPLLERLQENHADLITRRDELLAGIARAPVIINDEETAGKMADFAEQLTKFVKRTDAVHADEKAPFLTAGRTVDNFWHSLKDDIATGKTSLNVVRKKYADAKAAEELRRREELARMAREEAERLEREAAERAAAMENESDLAAAQKAEEDAEQARLDAEKVQKAADAKPAEMGRSRGDYGGLTTLKQFWDFADLDRAKLDLEALRQHIPEEALEKAVRSFIKADGRELAGVRIFENTRL